MHGRRSVAGIRVPAAAHARDIARQKAKPPPRRAPRRAENAFRPPVARVAEPGDAPPHPLRKVPRACRERCSGLRTMSMTMCDSGVPGCRHLSVQVPLRADHRLLDSGRGSAKALPSAGHGGGHEPWFDHRHRCHRPDRRVRDRDLQRSRPATAPDRRGVRPDRGPAQAPPRPDPEPRERGQGLHGLRAAGPDRRHERPRQRPSPPVPRARRRRPRPRTC